MPNAKIIDHSHHNANVNFNRVRAAGVAGVIHKATQGTGFVDSKYASRKQPAIEAGLRLQRLQRQRSRLAREPA